VDGGRAAAFDALILAGGAARRLDGADKPGLEVGGRSLLSRVVEACAGAHRVVVVGPRRPLPSRVSFVQESPPGGGPVAAIAAGLPLVSAPAVLVLAADLPWIAPAVPLLLEASVRSDAAVLVDADGRRNVLAAAWQRVALARALDAVAQPAGAAVRTLFSGVDCIEVVDDGGWGLDCDTWDDVARARERTTR
jgi:molybdopterin-guanine dinucleotide biosynthesis protein A